MIPSITISIIAFFWMIYGIQITEEPKEKFWDKAYLISMIIGWVAIFFEGVKIKNHTILLLYWFTGAIIGTTLLLVLPFHLYREGVLITVALSILINGFLLSAIITLVWWVMGFLVATYILLHNKY